MHHGQEDRYNDGVPYTYNQKICSSTVYGDEIETCADKTTTYKWTGCVGSRTNPLDTQDISPDKKYPGLLNTSCGAAITTLTSDYTKLRAAIKAMVANDEPISRPACSGDGTRCRRTSLSRTARPMTPM